MMKQILLGALLTTSGAYVVSTRAADTEMPSQASMTVAQTPDAHLAEAARYDAEAQRLEHEAARHRAMASSYAAFKGGSKSVPAFIGMAQHCRRLAASYERTAQDARTLAKAHRDMAKK